MATAPPVTSIVPTHHGHHGHHSAGSFNGLSNMNTAVYWGQGANQHRLKYYCEDDSIDIIQIGFLNVFSDQSGGYPGTNFGNQCGDETFKNPDGSDSPLLSHCPHIGHDIKFCQDKGKTVLLSIGGASPTDQYIESHQSAVDFADFLWAAFGPMDSTSGGGHEISRVVQELEVPRPFGDACVNGFDFDIESIFPEGQKRKEHEHYGTMINTLRTHYAEDESKTYYISGAPQCVIPDAHLAHAIQTSWFDFLFVQFYNTPECSARAYFDHKHGGSDNDISFDRWVEYVQTKSLNKDAKVFLGLPASKEVCNDENEYLSPEEADEIIDHFQCKYQDQFGGVMLYDAHYSDENRHHGKTYCDSCKDSLKKNDRNQCSRNDHSRHHDEHHGKHHGKHHSTTEKSPFSGVFPTGGFPSSLFPSVFPTGLFPSGVYPTGAFPTGLFRTGVFPTGVFPTGVFPTGAFPSGSVIPSGVFPSGSSNPSTGTAAFTTSTDTNPHPSNSASSGVPSGSSMPTISPSSSRMPYPLTNSSHPAHTSTHTQTSSNEHQSPSTPVIYETDIATITSCGPEVTNCPARPHTSMHAVSTITEAPQTTQEVVTTEIVTEYVTTCPVKHTITSAGHQVIQTEITTSTVTQTITSTICTKCVAPQKTAAPAQGPQSPTHGQSGSSHGQSTAQGSNSSTGSSSPGHAAPGAKSPAQGANIPGAMSHGSNNVASSSGSSPESQLPAQGANIPDAMSHGSNNVASSSGSSPESQLPAQGASSPGHAAPAAAAAVADQNQASPAENGPSMIQSTINFVPVETMTIVPVPKFPYQTAQASAPSAPSTASGNTTSPSGTASASTASGTGAVQRIEAFHGAASKTSAGVFGLVALITSVVMLS